MALFNRWRGQRSNDRARDRVVEGHEDAGQQEHHSTPGRPRIRYRDLVELSPEGILLHQRGTIVYANRAAARLAGAETADALVGRPLFELLTDDARQALQAPARTGPGGEPAVERLTLHRLDGASVAVEVTSMRIEHDDGPATCSTIRDVTAVLAEERAAAVISAFRLKMMDVANVDGIVAAAMEATSRLAGDAGFAVYLAGPGGGLQLAPWHSLDDDTARAVGGALASRFTSPDSPDLMIEDLHQSDLDPALRDDLLARGVSGLLATAVAAPGGTIAVIALAAAGGSSVRERGAGWLRTTVETALLGFHRLRQQEVTAVSEQRFRGAAEANQDAFLVMEPVRDAAGALLDFRVVFRNAASRRIAAALGAKRPPATLSRLARLSNLPFGRLLAEYRAALEQGEAAPVEFSLNVEGRRLWFERRVLGLGDAVAVSYRDVTAFRHEITTLGEAEADLRAILDSLGDMIVVYDLDSGGEFRLSYANSACAEFFGVEPEAIQGQASMEFLPAALRETVEATCGRACESHAQQSVPAECVVEGRRRCIDLTVTPILDAAGICVRTICSMTDRTAAREAEEGRRREERDRLAILDGLADMVMVSDRDDDGLFRISYANAALSQMAGREPEELVGTSAPEFIKPDVAAKLLALREQAIATAQMTSGDFIVDIGGRDRHLNIGVTPIFDDAGEAVRVVWRATDLTGQRESEEELERIESSRDAILNGLSDAVYVLDRDAQGEFRFTYANRPAAFLADPELLLGKTIGDFLQAEPELAGAEALLDRCLREGRAATGEIELAVDGRMRVIDCRVTPVAGADGTVGRVIWRASDLTERRASERLFQAAAVAGLQAFNVLDPVYGPDGAITDWAFRYTNEKGLEFNRRYAGVERPTFLSEMFGSAPQGFERERALYEDVFRTGVAFDGEFKTRDTEGQVSWYRRQVLPVEGGVVATGVDITEGKLRAEQVAEAERLQRSILDSLSDAVLLVDCEAGGAVRVVYANRAYLERTGRALDDVAGRSPDEFLPAERAEAKRAILAKAFETGRTIELETSEATAAGEEIRLVTAIPMGSDDHGRARVLWRSADLTPLRKSEARFRAAAEANLDHFMLFEPVRNQAGLVKDFRVIFANQTALKHVHSYSGPQSPQLLSEMFIHDPENFAETLATYVAVLESGQASREETYTEAAGTPRWFDRQLVPVGTNLMATYRNVTEARLSQLTLESAARDQQALLDGITDALYLLEEDEDDWRIVYANEMAIRVRGAAGAVGRRLSDLLTPEEVALRLELIAEAVATGERRSREFSFGPNGEGEEWLRLSATPLSPGPGGKARVIWQVTDLTEARAQQRRLAEAERNQRAILDALSDVLIVLDRGEDGEFRVGYINAAREALTGRPDSQLLGKVYEEYLEADGAERLRAAVDQAIAGQRTVDFGGVTPDAEGRPLHYSARITPVFEADGGCDRVILRYTDVTATALAEQRMLEARRDREAIVESLADIVLIFDADDEGTFRLNFANPPFYATGRTHEETDGRSFPEFLSPGEAAIRAELEEAAIAAREPIERELTVNVKGRVFHYKARISPIFDESGGCRRTIWRYSDVTELVARREELAAREREQRAILEALSDIIVVADRDGHGGFTIGYVNPAVERAFGIAAGSLTGRRFEDFPAEAGRDPDHGPIHRAAAERGPVDYLADVEVDGRHYRVAARLTPVFDDAGELARVIARYTDITDAARAESMLGRLGRVVDSSTDELYIVDALSLKILQANRSASRDLGYDPGALEGMHISAIVEEPSGDRAANLSASLRTGPVSRLTFEGRLRRRDGSSFPVEARVEYLAHEDPPVLLATARDISERKEMQDSLARMAAIVESSADVVVGVDTAGTITQWNRAAEGLLGIAAHAALGRPVEQVFEGTHFDTAKFELGASAATSFDTLFMRADGEPISLSVVSFPVSDFRGERLGSAIVARDVRWRVEALRALRESETRFRTVFDQGPEGILLQRASDGAVLDVNRKLLDAASYDREEVLGRHPIDLGVVQRTDALMEVVDAVRAGGRPPACEVTMLTRDGREVEMQLTVEPIELNGERCILSFLSNISALKETQRLLTQAQEALRSIAENLPVILTSWDRRGLCTFAAGHGLEMAGLDAEGLIGRPVREIVGPWMALDTATTNGGSIEFALGGHIFEAQYRPLPDGSGTVAVAIDVTEQRTALHQLESIVEQMPITLLGFDVDGIVTACHGGNPPVVARLTPDAVGRSLFDLYPEVPGVQEAVRRVLAGEQFATTFITGGTRTVDVHFTPTLGPDGRPAGGVAVILDITEKLKAEEALRESNERFRQIAETASDGIVSVALDGRIRFVNQALAGIFGYEREELVGQPLTILMPYEVASRHREAFHRYAETGARSLDWNSMELTGRRKDGSEFTLEMSISEGTQEGERVVTGFLRDITERRRTEEALMQAQKLESLGVLAGGIAHDFNNMLVAIMGNAGLALADLPDSSPARETVEEIELAARRAAELARQMLAYSGKGRLTVSRLDLTALVEEIPHLLRTSIGKGVSLRYELARDLPAVEADATQLRQVVMNLVINASEAIGDREGVIAISTGVLDADRAYLKSTYVPGEVQPGRYCYLEVADSGNGMSPETLSRIFDPFFTTKFTGKGLGLAAVLGIIRGHRGTVKVESAPGTGTRFRILIPAAAGKAEPADLPDTELREWTGSGTVLVVDDEEPVRNVAARALRGAGFDVLVAGDGLEAVEIFATSHQTLACVLMDLTMPRMNGEAAASEMREIDPGVPIVLMSGYDESEMPSRFRAEGLAGFVQKPFEIRSLRDAVRRASRAISAAD